MVDSGGLVSFVGTWSSGTLYDRGECVVRTAVLYQSTTDNNLAHDPATSASWWVAMTDDIATLTGSVDPTTGAGIPAAVASTYQRAASLVYTKTDTGATDWEGVGGGGGGSISATDGTTTVDPATSIQFRPGTVNDLGAGIAGVGLGPVVYLESNGDTDSPDKFVWDTFYDADWTEIAELPAEMGMSIDVANEVLTTLEPGTWAWVLGTNLHLADDTAILSVQVVDGGYYGNITSTPSPASGDYKLAFAGAGPSVTGVSRMKAAAEMYARVKAIGATADPYHPINYAVLTLMRLS